MGWGMGRAALSSIKSMHKQQHDDPAQDSPQTTHTQCATQDTGGAARAASAGVSNVSFEQADAEELSKYADASFDAVVCSFGVWLGRRAELCRHRVAMCFVAPPCLHHGVVPSLYFLIVLNISQG